jgi:hypothetical protein
MDFSTDVDRVEKQVCDLVAAKGGLEGVVGIIANRIPARLARCR